MNKENSSHNGNLNLVMEEHSADIFKKVAIQFEKDKREYLKNNNSEKNSKSSISYSQEDK